MESLPTNITSLSSSLSSNKFLYRAFHSRYGSSVKISETDNAWFLITTSRLLPTNLRSMNLESAFPSLYLQDRTCGFEYPGGLEDCLSEIVSEHVITSCLVIFIACGEIILRGISALFLRKIKCASNAESSYRYLLNTHLELDSFKW